MPRPSASCHAHMNHSEFWTVLDDVFGSAYGQALAKNLALPELGHRTADELLEAGEPPLAVWGALCREMNVEDKVFHHRVNPKERS